MFRNRDKKYFDGMRKIFKGKILRGCGGLSSIIRGVLVLYRYYFKIRYLGGGGLVLGM